MIYDHSPRGSSRKESAHCWNWMQMLFYAKGCTSNVNEEKKKSSSASKKDMKLTQLMDCLWFFLLLLLLLRSMNLYFTNCWSWGIYRVLFGTPVNQLHFHARTLTLRRRDFMHSLLNLKKKNRKNRYYLPMKSCVILSFQSDLIPLELVLFISFFSTAF